MNTLRSFFLIVVGLISALGFAPSVSAKAGPPPTNQATLQLENLWRVWQRSLARFAMQVSVGIDRLFGTRNPFALGITADEQILKALDEQNTRLKKLDTIEAAVGEQKKSVDKLTTDLAEVQQKQIELQRLSVEGMSAEPVRAVLRSQHVDSIYVSDGLAKHLAANFILHCERSRTIEALCSMPEQREKLLTVARRVLGIQGKTAITTGDIPLPTSYSSEMKELISEFGVCRRKMSPFPIGMGTARPARWGTRPAFGSIAMSAAITEKSPTLTFASLESHKVGGLVRLPREIDEQSIVPMGQFLARYGAVEFARAEDTWGFLADGTGTYENVAGIVKIATDNDKSVVLAAATGPHDATLADFRAMRTKVNKAALSGRLSAYYLDTTWETRLPNFKTEADPFAYVRNADGSATLDGYPIVWTDVLEPYGTADVTSKPIACFGALSFWWFGEHGSPRIDTSEHVFFANDQLATRFIEEIDFDYAALDAMAVLLTGPAS